MTYSHATSRFPTIASPSARSASGTSMDLVSLLRRGPSEFGPVALAGAKARLAQVSALGQNWDGFDSDAPRKESVEFAYASLPALYVASTHAGLPWVTPHVTANEKGEVVFEWWNGERKLALYFGDGFVDFVQAWGPHVDEEMNEGTIDFTDFGTLWQWLQA